MSNEKILEAVQIIKAVCKEHKCCCDCPYGVDDNDETQCNIKQECDPEWWNIKPFVTFKAFM